MTEKEIRRTILIVEDEEGYRELLESLLSARYDLTLCDTIEQAAEKLDTARFDLVISDINLHDKSGLELLMRLRMQGKATPLVVCSSQTDDGTKQIASGMGAAAFIEKPFKVDLLLGQVESLLKKI